MRFNALDNIASFKPLRLTCQSDDAIGSSDLTAGILSSITQLGSAEILSHQGGTAPLTPYASRPLVYPSTPQTGSASMSSVLVLVIIIIVGWFAFTKL